MADGSEPSSLEGWKALAQERQRELEDLVETSDELEAALEGELASATAESKRLATVVAEREADLEKLKARLHEHKSSLDKSMDSHDKLTHRNEELEVKTRDLENRNDELEKEVRILQVSLEDSKRELDKMTEQVAFLQGEKEESEERLERLRAETRDLKSELEVLEEQVKKIPESNSEESDSQIAELESKLDDLVANSEKQASAVEKWKKKYEEAKAKLSAMKTQLAEQASNKESCADQQQALEDLEIEWKEKLDAAHDQIAELKANQVELESAQAEASEAKAELDKALKKVQDLQEKYDRCNTESKAVRDELDAVLHRAEARDQSMEDEVEVLKTANEKLTKQIAIEKSAQESLKESVLELESKLEAQIDAGNQADTERLGELQAEFSLKFEKLEQENVDLKSINERLDGELSQLEHQVSKDNEAVARAEALEEQNQAIQEDMQKTQSRLEELQIKHKRLDEAKSALEARFAGHEDLVDQLERDSAQLNALEVELEATKRRNQELAVSAEEAREEKQILQQSLNEGGGLPKDVVHLRQAYAAQLKANASLLSRMQKLKGNILVCCRIRPLLSTERQDASDGSAVEALSSEELSFCAHKVNEVPRPFAFDRVFSPETSQGEVCHELTSLGIAESVVGGTNACIMAYGQTGSGKTFTMDGPEGGLGVNAVTIRRIFELVNMLEQSAQGKYEVHLAMMEIYNDEVRDLLNGGKSRNSISSAADTSSIASSSTVEGGSSSRSPSHRKHSKIAGATGDLTWVECDSLETVDETLSKGRKIRSTAATNLNLHSSRSHLIIILEVTAVSKVEEDETEAAAVQTGLLYLVDLAGSERVSKSGVEGSRLDEARHINRSLSALGDVMQALDSKDRKHVPYRNSKLTHLLKPVLGGNARTIMILAVPPTLSSAAETLQSLNFCARARKIELGPAKRQVQLKADLQDKKKLTDEVQALRGEKNRLETKLADALRELHVQSQSLSAQKVEGSKKEEAQRKRLENELAAMVKENGELRAKYTRAKEAAKSAKGEIDSSERKVKSEHRQLTQAVTQSKRRSTEQASIIEKQRNELLKLRAELEHLRQSAPSESRSGPATGKTRVPLRTISTPRGKAQRGEPATEEVSPGGSVVSQQNRLPLRRKSRLSSTVPSPSQSSLASPGPSPSPSPGRSAAGFGSGAPRFRSKIPRPGSTR